MIRPVLQTGCLISGILCFFYFLFILYYVGHTEWFQFVWLFAGAILFVLWLGLRCLNQHPDSLLRYPVNAALLLGAAGILVMLLIGSGVVKDMTGRPPQNLQYVIVLGAQVRGTQPSRALRKRLDCALEYAEENPDTIFILSGGQGSDEEISEAQCMYNYMKEKGMDTQRLLMEDRSTSTKENLRFSAELLDKRNSTVGILSNNFHIHRALLLAGKEGYLYTFGIPAPTDPAMQLHYVVREIFALAVMKIRG